MPSAGACPVCGYDLSGLARPACPECGVDAEAWHRAKLEAAHDAQSAAVVSLAVLGLFVALSCFAAQAFFGVRTDAVALAAAGVALAWAMAAVVWSVVHARRIGTMSGPRYAGAVGVCAGPVALLMLFYSVWFGLL